MFYSDGNYMQDFNSYNQNPNLIYQSYLQNNNFQNASMNSTMRKKSYSAMYPAIYRIINPVVLQVLSNTNSSYLTEDGLNNLVDTVYSIVEGDINLNKLSNENTATSQTENMNSRTASNTNLNNNSTNTSNKSNTLLRDLIKIMILNEVITKNRNNFQMMNMMPNGNFNQQMYM